MVAVPIFWGHAMRPKPKRVPIAPPTLKERVMDHLAAVIAVVVTAVILIIIIGPMVFVEMFWWVRRIVD